MIRSWIVVSALVPMAFAAAAQGGTPAPAGPIRLLDVGNYRVAYQYEGKEITWLPEGWVGHFQEGTGVSYTAWGQQDGVPALLIHCPWRNGTGRTFAEYDLRLPAGKPVRLQLAIAMAANGAADSDGVTFRAFLTSGRMHLDLLDEHYTSTQWERFDFDLSTLAGKDVIIHLEVDPGPKRDPSFDYSLWGDPRIVSGEKEPSLPERLASLKALRARWDAAPRDLLKLSNRRDTGCSPNVDDRFENRVHVEGESFVLEYQGRDCRVRYRIPKETADIAEATVQVDDMPPFRCWDGAGATLSDGDTSIPPDSPDYSRELVDATPVDNGLEVRSRLRGGNAEALLRERVTIGGKSLRIEADCEQPNIVVYSIGRLGPVAFQRTVQVPYLTACDVRYLPDKALFCSWLLDWVDTGATSHGEHDVFYSRLTDGRRNPLHNVGYVTVSPDVAEVLPNIPLPPSPFFDALKSRIVLDIWGGAFDEDARTLATLKSYGVDNAAIIKHVWQNAGYDNALPATLPANEGLGGDDAMKRYADAARRVGYLLSLHENYVDYYPNFPGYTEDDVLRAPDGSLVEAWYNAGTGIQSFAFKPTAWMKYAREYSPEIHRRFGTTAAYLDVHTCVPPWFRVEANAAEPGAGTCRKNFEVQSELFQFERDAHGGPLFGEGSGHMYWAGLMDGVEAQVEGGESAPLLADFDLLKIHPQMVNHGMGYYERWLQTGYETAWGRAFPTGELTDKYRSEEIIFGHAGFMGGLTFRSPELAAREHHLVSPLQERYAPSRPVEILYEVAREMVPVSIAVALDTLDRAYVRYESGLQVWCNWREDDWKVQGHSIPQYCFLALGEGVEAWTLSVDGVFVDYCEVPESLFADARPGGGIPGTLRPQDIRVELADFQDLGGRKMRIGYRWRVKDVPGEGYRVFVHFTGAKSTHAEEISFQQDHELATPTANWRRGDEVQDGPFELQVPGDIPAGDYDLRIGLYGSNGRLQLRGYGDGQGRIILGTLTVGEDGSLKWHPAELPAEAEGVADSHPGNTDGRMIDFGKVATNGAALIRLGNGHLEIIPTWRDKPFEMELRLAEVRPEWTGKTVTVKATDADSRALGERTLTAEKGVLRLTVEAGTARVDVRPM